MLDTNAGRWLIGAIAALAVIALLAWARNDPGVDDREPDPPTSSVSAVPEEPATVDSVPPATT